MLLLVEMVGVKESHLASSGPNPGCFVLKLTPIGCRCEIRTRDLLVMSQLIYH